MRYLTFLAALTAIFTSHDLITAAAPEQPQHFEDNFEDGLEKWQLLDPETWKLRAQTDHSKTLEITARESAYAPKFRSPLHIALIKDLQLADFEMTFKVRSTKDTGNHRDCCVFFGYQDADHFYYAHLGALPDPHSGQLMIVDAAPRLALTQNTTPVPWDDQWHNVRLVRKVSDGTIAVYFDDFEKPLMQAKDQTFGSGRIGIGSFDDMDEFDEIQIQELAK